MENMFCPLLWTDKKKTMLSTWCHKRCFPSQRGFLGISRWLIRHLWERCFNVWVTHHSPRLSEPTWRIHLLLSVGRTCGAELVSVGHLLAGDILGIGRLGGAARLLGVNHAWEVGLGAGGHTSTLPLLETYRKVEMYDQNNDWDPALLSWLYRSYVHTKTLVPCLPPFFFYGLTLSSIWLILLL